MSLESKIWLPLFDALNAEITSDGIMKKGYPSNIFIFQVKHNIKPFPAGDENQSIHIIIWEIGF